MGERGVHLEKRLGPCFPLREAVSEKGAQHVPLDFLIWTESLRDYLLPNPNYNSIQSESRYPIVIRERVNSEGDTNPINLPIPTVSVSFGRNRRRGFQKNTFASAGQVPSRVAKGNKSSMVFAYELTSSSASRFPNAVPNAISEIISRVRNWNLAAMSAGLNSIDVDTYLESRNCTSLAILSSMDISRYSLSLPAYLEISISHMVA